MEPIKFPQHVDDQQRLFFWTADQVIVFAIFFAGGILTNHFFYALILGIGIAKLFTRFRDSRPDGFILHAMHWYGISPLRGRSALNPFLRRILPA